jgi:maltose O-acetyltransferase
MLAKFNATSGEADAKRHTSLTELFERIGEGTMVKPTLRCDYGFNVAIGSRTFINYDCLLLDCNRITIGDEVQIAPGVHIYTATHPIEAKARRSGIEYALPVVIGDGVWLRKSRGLSRRHDRSEYGGWRRERCHSGFTSERSRCRQPLSRNTATMI